MPVFNTRIRLTLLIALLTFGPIVYGQQVTGIWKGRISKRNVEVKIVQNGDSLAGTAYYYESPGNYRRYSIKGYFDPNTNSVIWWDDQLLSLHAGRNSQRPLLSVADFNCPGGGVMKLEGAASPKDDREHPDGRVNLTKTDNTSFPDEWDPVIDNYTIGSNDPDIIDSVARIALTTPGPGPVATESRKEPEPSGTVIVPPPPQAVIVLPQTIEEKFNQREKKFTREIPVSGDSVELRFYDNAEIDGDSISLFLNGQLLFTHVRLSDKAYTIRLAVKDLDATSELVMVAENLGAIPPNTSYMLAIVGDQRYEAMLASTEQSSAMIRLKKE